MKSARLRSPPQFHKGTPLVLMGFPPRWRSGSSGRWHHPSRDEILDIATVEGVIECPSQRGEDLARQLVGFSLAIAGGRNTTCTCPAIKSVSAGPPPRYGTCTRLTSAIFCGPAISATK